MKENGKNSVYAGFDLTSISEYHPETNTHSITLMTANTIADGMMLFFRHGSFLSANTERSMSIGPQ